MRPARDQNLGRRRAHVTAVAALVAFVVAVYVVVVLGIGVLIGQTDSPNLLLSVVATVIVALAFEPVRRRSEAAALRVFRGQETSPYDVLSRFSETVTGGYPTAELPERMARLLAEGTSAEW